MRWPSREGLVPGGGAGPGQSLLDAKQRLRAEATPRLLWTFKAVVIAGERTRVERTVFGERPGAPDSPLDVQAAPFLVIDSYTTPAA